METTSEGTDEAPLAEVRPLRRLERGPETDIDTMRPSDYDDNLFAALQLSEWAHPSTRANRIVGTILAAADTDPFIPDDSIDTPLETDNQHLVKLMAHLQYGRGYISEDDPILQFFAHTYVLVQDDPDKMRATDVVRIIYSITKIESPHPIPPSNVVLTVLKKIILNKPASKEALPLAKGKKFPSFLSIVK